MSPKNVKNLIFIVTVTRLDVHRQHPFNPTELERQRDKHCSLNICKVGLGQHYRETLVTDTRPFKINKIRKRV